MAVTRAWWLVVLAAAGCGRIGFDHAAARGDDGDAGHDGSSIAAFGPCAAPAATSSSATISGTTIQYTDYSSYEALPAVPLAIADASGATLGSMTSDGSGDFAISIPIAGNATTIGLATPPGGYESTTLYPGVPITGDLGGLQIAVWNIGAIASIYGTGNAPYDDTLAMLSVGVLRCDGTPIGDATVSILPAPAQVDYLFSDGQPQQGLTATDPTTGYALGFGTQPGPTTVTAAADGASFTPISIVAGSGEHIDVVHIYAHE
jgi:hypothetical protein